MPYQSRHAGTLADLLLQQGDIAAQRAQRSGDVWANVAQGIAGIPAGMQQRRQADRDRAAQQALLDSRLKTDALQQRNIEGQINARDAAQMDEQATKDLAQTTMKVNAWLADVAATDGDVQRAAYRSGRAALIQEGRLQPSDAPEMFPGVSWVKSRMAMLLPATERFQQLFPEPEKGVVLPRGAQMRSPTTGDMLADNPMTPDAPTPGTFEDYLTAPPDRQAHIEAARKRYQQADDRPQMGATVVIQTVDAQGNPVTKIVPKTAGAEFAAPQTGAQRQQTAENTAVLTGLTRLDDLTKTPGTLEKWVGPVEGRVNAANLALPGVKVDPAMAEFFAETAAIKNRMIRAITGAQMSEPEARRIMSQLPDINQKPEVFRARMAATKRNLEALNTAMAAKTATAPRGNGDADFDWVNGQLVPRKQ